MLKRKAMQQLLEWKNNPSKMCLIVEGARQVGKTYIIEEFGKENYKNFININFITNDKFIKVFDGSLSGEEIIKKLSLEIKETPIEEGNTLIFLDEIQACPRAITALKFLTIYNKIDIIASGSLLGINDKDVPSFPVGYVNHLYMHSLDFEEFCWANGMSETAFGYIKEYFDKKEEVPISSHERMLSLFKEYIIVGGMPKAVQTFIDTNNFNEVLKVQKDIISDYDSDIAKYAEMSEKTKVKDCFYSIPRQLAKDYKKFQFKIVEPKGSYRKYEGSLRWLIDADIVSPCYNISNPELPLEGNARIDAFKIYMRDTGLLMAMLEEGSAKEIMDGNLGIYKGAIYENIIADIFTKNNKKLYYFEKNSTLEIDFFIRYENTATAIEVKSADNTKSKSLTSVINNYGVKKGIKLSTKNIRIKDNIECYPIYMAIFL